MPLSLKRISVGFTGHLVCYGVIRVGYKYVPHTLNNKIDQSVPRICSGNEKVSKVSRGHTKGGVSFIVMLSLGCERHRPTSRIAVLVLVFIVQGQGDGRTRVVRSEDVAQTPASLVEKRPPPQ